MSVQAVTHLNFQGQARAALAFYHSVFGGQLTQFTYQDFGQVADPVDAERIVFGQVATQDGFRIMAFDVASGKPWQQGENAFYVSLSGANEAEIRTLWDKLADGAAIEHALEPAQWAPLYGMLRDRFGVVWAVNVVASGHAG